MKSGMNSQLLVGIIFAVVLVVLFSKSEVDYRIHAENLVHILALQRLDNALDAERLRLRNGDTKNYDGLTRLNRELDIELSQLRQLSLDNFLFEKETMGKLVIVQEQIEEKRSLMEKFKEQTAFVNLLKAIFPASSRTFTLNLAQHRTVSETDKNHYRERIRRLVAEVNGFVLGESINSEKVDALIDFMRQDESKIPKDLQKDYLQILNYSAALIEDTRKSKQLVIQMDEMITADTINSFRQSYIDAFSNHEKTAGNYRVAMFLTAIALLIYLFLLFRKLKSATDSLNKTLGRLEFQKRAIDEHAIVSITDVRGDIIYANQRFVDISGYSRKELIGENHRIIKSHRHDPDFYREMWRTIASGTVWHGLVCNENRHGEEYWVDSTILPQLNAKGKPEKYISIRTDITAQIKAEQDVALLARFPVENPEPVLRFSKTGEVLFSNKAADRLLSSWSINEPGIEHDGVSQKIIEALEMEENLEQELHLGDKDYVLTYTPVVDEAYVNVYGRDVTARKKAEEDLKYQANHDPLTGLYNRHSFDRELEKVLEESYRGDASVLLYLDLDQFKVVNDTCGHVAGDELLRQLTSELEKVTRQSDIVARLGGDEFGIILKRCSQARGEEVAKKVQSVIRDYRFSWGDKSFAVGVSIGLVPVDGDIGNKSDLLRIADVACYTAKDRGRDLIHIYDAEDSQTSSKQAEMHWASMIPSALSENRFVLMAQDIVPLDVNSGLHKHYEILVRMVDQDGSFIPPGAFIPAAERYNLMPAIDHWVIRNVIAKLVDAKNRYGSCPVQYVAINLSGETMNKGELLDFIGAQIKQHPFLAAALSFEVTETAAISNLSAAIHFINELKKLGCEFALDDFGSGLSSFGYLKNLPVDYLKIDGAFVKDILDDPIDEAMVVAINQIGHVMDIHTIAEFVENQEIADRLLDIGVDYAQGFGIAKPILLDDVIERDLKLINKVG